MSAAAATKSLLYHLPLGQTTYARASLIQESLVSLHLAHKTRNLLLQRNPTFPTSPSPLPPLPAPTIITAEFSPPVYTSGLRQLSKIPASEKHELTTTPHPVTGDKALFIETRRGGQITWHGRGQCTIYPVFDLRSIHIHPSSSSSSSSSTPPLSLPKKPLGVRTWVDLLESVTISTLASYGVAADRDPEHTGVWCGENKITAVGVRVRRFVVSHGVGVNVCTDPWWWGRVVPCGIVGRGVTDLVGEMENVGGIRGEGEKPGVEEVGRRWVGEMAGRMGRVVKVVGVEEVLGEGWEGRLPRGEVAEEEGE